VNTRCSYGISFFGYFPSLFWATTAASVPDLVTNFLPLMNRLLLLRPISRAIRTQGTASGSRTLARALSSTPSRNFGPTAVKNKKKKIDEVDASLFGFEEDDEVVPAPEPPKGTPGNVLSGVGFELMDNRCEERHLKTGETLGRYVICLYVATLTRTDTPTSQVRLLDPADFGEGANRTCLFRTYNRAGTHCSFQSKNLNPNPNPNSALKNHILHLLESSILTSTLRRGLHHKQGRY
jgi:hypothetical protein